MSNGLCKLDQTGAREQVKDLLPKYLKPLDENNRAKDFISRKSYLKDIIKEAHEEAERLVLDIKQRQPFTWLVLCRLVSKAESLPGKSNGNVALHTASYFITAVARHILEFAAAKKSVIGDIGDEALKLLDSLDKQECIKVEKSRS